MRINNLTAKNLFQLEGKNLHLTVTGKEGDISNLCRFDWYQWCYFGEKKYAFPFAREVLGRVLGPAKGEGNGAMGIEGKWECRPSSHALLSP